MLLKETKVYTVLSKFDKYEQNRCRKYVQSPYFNTNEQLIHLYEFITSTINKSSKKDITKIDVWKKLYKNKGYDDVRLRKYISDLLKLIEGYIAQQYYESDPLVHSTDLIKAAKDKKLVTLYNNILKRVKSISEKQKNLSANYFYQQYKIEDYAFELADYKSKINEKSNYEEIINNLDQFFLAEKLRVYCNILSRERVSSFKYRINFIEEVLNYVKSNFDKVAPNVEIYYRIHLTYTNTENTENYSILKKLLNKYATDFVPEEAFNIYMQILNYCVKKVRAGNNDFFLEMFELYKMMIAKDLIYENGILNPSLFRNIISASTRLMEFEWAENFIISYQEKLPETQRENMVTFNLSMLSFMQKKYDKVITLLRDVEYSDISLSLQSKTMLLMTYYDTDEFEPLDFLLESFRVYLNRHREIPKHRVDYHKNLIKYTKKLTRVIPGDKDTVAKIKQEIEETEGFRVKWLEEKIVELEN